MALKIKPIIPRLCVYGTNHYAWLFLCLKELTLQTSLTYHVPFAGFFLPQLDNLFSLVTLCKEKLLWNDYWRWNFLLIEGDGGSDRIMEQPSQSTTCLFVWAYSSSSITSNSTLSLPNVFELFLARERRWRSCFADLAHYTYEYLFITSQNFKILIVNKNTKQSK